MSSSSRTAPPRFLQTLLLYDVRGSRRHRRTRRHRMAGTRTRGQWGRDVPDGSALGEELSEALGEAVSQAGLKFLLIRQAGRAGRRASNGALDASGNPTHRVLYAPCTPGEEKLYSFSVSTPSSCSTCPDNPEALIQATSAELMDSPPFPCALHPSVTAAALPGGRSHCGAPGGYPAGQRGLGVLAYGRSPLCPRSVLCCPPVTPTVASRAFGTGGVPVTGGSLHSVAARAPARPQHGYSSGAGGRGCCTP